MSESRITRITRIARRRGFGWGWFLVRITDYTDNTDCAEKRGFGSVYFLVRIADYADNTDCAEKRVWMRMVSCQNRGLHGLHGFHGKYFVMRIFVVLTVVSISYSRIF